MAETSFEQVMIRKSLDKVLVKDLMVKPKGFSPDESVHAIVHSKILHNIHDAYPVIEKGKFLGVLKRAMVQKIKPQLRKDMTVKKLITKPPFKVKPKDKIYPLLTKMVQSNAPLVPVYQGKVFKGILRREDIVEYIRMNA